MTTKKREFTKTTDDALAAIERALAQIEGDKGITHTERMQALERAERLCREHADKVGP